MPRFTHLHHVVVLQFLQSARPLIILISILHSSSPRSFSSQAAKCPPADGIFGGRHVRAVGRRRRLG
eukprot:8026799-Pyramimonas_sp.AAC.1